MIELIAEESVCPIPQFCTPCQGACVLSARHIPQPRRHKVASALLALTDVLNHFAKFLHFVKRENIENRNEIFYKKNLTDETKSQRVWQIYQRAAYTQASSRKKKDIESKTSVASTRKSKRIFLQNNEEIKVISDFSKKSSQDKEQDLFISEDEKNVIEDDDEDENESKNELNDVNIKSLHTKIKMRLERTSENFDLFERWWQRALIKTLCDISTDEVIKINFTNNYNSNEDLSVESLTWVKEIDSTLDENMINIITSFQATTTRFLQQQTLLDREKYQRSDLKEACQRLDIVDIKHFRLQSMSRSQKFKFWQFDVINAFLKFDENDWLRRSILIDDMSLEKTVMTAEYILRICVLKTSSVLLQSIKFWK